MIETDFAYVAGLIDGDGCFSTSHNGSGYLNISLRLVNRDKPTLNWLALKFGGTVVSKGNVNIPDHWNPTYQWVVSSGPLKELLPEIIPYLRIRKAQAELTLDFVLLPYESTDERWRLRGQISELNNREYA